MNIKEKTYQNKLSIYDLLVVRNKNVEKIRKDQLKKQLSINLSDIGQSDKSKCEKKKFKQELNSVDDRYNNKNRELIINEKINVIMEGKAAQEILQPSAFDKKRDNFLMGRFQKNILEENQIPSVYEKDEHNPKSLAVVSDLGTVYKYGLSRRPGKLIPISTLRPRQNQTSENDFLLEKNIENKNRVSNNEINEKVLNLEDSKDKIPEQLDPNNEDQKQRKRSKIRSVEEILSSLKSDDYIHNQMESDIRIDELIKKVLERSDDVEDMSIDEKVKNVDEQFKEEQNLKDVYIKGEFEKEAEKMLQELEMDQNSKTLESNTLHETFIDENVSHMDTAKSFLDLEGKDEEKAVNMNIFLQDMDLNLEVTNEDLIGVYGKHLNVKLPIEKSLIDQNVIREKKPFDRFSRKSIHHICSLKKDLDPTDPILRKQWVAQYIPDKYSNYKAEIQGNLDLPEQERIEKAAKNIINEKEKIEKWEKIAHQLLEENNTFEIVGTYIAPSAIKMEDLWQHVAPKLNLRPYQAREVVCPSYNIQLEDFKIEEVTTENTFEKNSMADMVSSTENSFCEEIDLEALETKEKLISRRNGSLENIPVNIGNAIVSTTPYIRSKMRSSSVPNKHWLEEDSLIIHLEYHQIMEEINIQKRKIKMLSKASHEKENNKELLSNNKDELPILEENKEEVCNDLVSDEKKGNDSQSPPGKIENFLSPAQKALIAGQNYVYYPPRKSRKSKNKPLKNISRISSIETFLGRPANKLEKTVSFSNLQNSLYYGKKNAKKNKTKNKITSQCRSQSLSNLYSFDNWARKYGYNNEESTREWITVVWDKWFDEIYPPLLNNDETMSSIKIMQDSHEISFSTKNNVHEDTMVSTTDILELPEKIDAVLEEVEEEFKDSVIETLHQEILSLTEEMMKNHKPNAFLLSRRGCIYKKLGFLRAALHDLNEAISLEPQLLTAYWERHLLHLVINKSQLAIEDLNFILKNDKTNVAAYKSRANIYASLGDISLAISNLSQAVRLAPNDIDAFLKRADLYEKNGDQRLALEDYNQLIMLQPNNSLAMMKHGLYYINIEQWHLAIKDFSDILRHDPLNAEARLYRGLALSKLHQWQESLLDYSAVIHLEPNNPKAYFRRGCLLQKAEPSLAIRDFSISLLLDSTEENILSYLYRAVLYAQTKQYSEAIVDFEMVIYFSKDMCCAHVNLGLIYFEKEEYEKAIKYFSLGLSADPTYIRAYACRAEAYFKLNMYSEAIKDVNRAIHVYPDRSNYYMLRGDFYLAKGKMNLAEMCVRQAAAISHNLGQSLVQQALVHSFLHNYDQAIEALYQSTRNKPTLALLNLLGVTQMKAKKWKDAITSFSICLEQMKPKSQFKPWPPAASNLYFMVAQCYLELNDYKQSQQAFKATVKINPKYAEAYYQQGWCRLRLGQLKKGILDLNMALAINPKLYQAYMARATLFGYKKQYTKAILNCNEVINIEPKCLRAYLYRGVLKYKIKAYSLAVRDLTEAINLDPSCILAYFNRALCYNSEKRYFDKAIQDYSIVFMLKDELKLHQKSYLNRGIVYLELGDVQNALLDFRKAYSMDSKNINVLMAVGICHHRLKNLNNAILTFSQCLDNYPKFLLPKICRGNVFLDFNTTQSREMAVKDFESVIKVDRYNLDAFINLGFCMQAQQKFKAAWEIFTKAIENHPNSIKPLDGRAIVCLQMGDLRGALKDLNAAITINPQSSMLYTNRGVVHQLMGDGTRSMKDYNKAILISNDKSVIAYYNIGCIYLHNRQIQQAFDSFMSTVTIDPLDEAAWMNLSIIHIFNNKPKEALECIDKAISLAPYVASFYSNRANVFYQLQEYKKAETDFSTCLNITPDDAQIYKARADCRSKLEDVVGAIEDYKASVYISNCLRKTKY